MHDNTLLAIAMTVSALGIAMLMFALTFLEVPLTRIGDVSSMVDNSPVRIKGDVLKVRTITTNGSDPRTILTISQTCSIDVLLEDAKTSNQTKDAKSAYNKGNCLQITGKKATYKDNAQITASKIVKC